jgi:hypothetical protein
MLAGTAVQCLAIVWYVALGSAIGRFAAPLLAGLAGGGFAATLLMGDAVSGHAFRLLAFGSSTVSQLGLQYNAGYLAGQAAILSITAARCLLLPIRMRGSARVPNLMLQGTLAVAVVRIGYAHLAWLPPLAYTLACMMFGYAGDEPRYYWWAVIMQERTTDAQWAVCGCALALVFVAYSLAAPRYRDSE